MRLYVDSADVTAIRQALATGYVSGVTTNPTLLRRAGLQRGDIPSLVRTAVEAGAGEVHLQVLSPGSTAMMEDGLWLHGLDPAHVLVKVPATKEGLGVGARLAAQGVGVTCTAVYAARQLILASAVGARYAAVYLGRMRDAGQNALETIGGMMTVVRAQQMTVRLLVASVRTPEDVEALAALGVPCATLPPELLSALPQVGATLDAVRTFEEDAEHL